MNIYLDYDSTLVDFNSAWVKFIQNNINESFLLSNIETYDQRVHNDDDMHKLARRFWKIKDQYDTVKPFDGALNFVDLLQKSGHIVNICTSTSNGTHDFKTNHILDNFYGILKHTDIIHVSNTCLKWQYTRDGILIDDFILPVLNHVFSNRLPGIVFNYSEMHPHANVTLNDKSFADNVYKIDSTNLYYSTNYDQLFDMIKYLGVIHASL